MNDFAVPAGVYAKDELEVGGGDTFYIDISGGVLVVRVLDFAIFHIKVTQLRISDFPIQVGGDIIHCQDIIYFQVRVKPFY